MERDLGVSTEKKLHRKQECALMARVANGIPGCTLASVARRWRGDRPPLLKTFRPDLEHSAQVYTRHTPPTHPLAPNKDTGKLEWIQHRATKMGRGWSTGPVRSS